MDNFYTERFRLASNHVFSFLVKTPPKKIVHPEIGRTQHLIAFDGKSRKASAAVTIHPSVNMSVRMIQDPPRGAQWKPIGSVG